MEEWSSQSDMVSVACDVLVPHVEKIYLTVGVTVDLHSQKKKTQTYQKISSKNIPPFFLLCLLACLLSAQPGLLVSAELVQIHVHRSTQMSTLAFPPRADRGRRAQSHSCMVFP